MEEPRCSVSKLDQVFVYLNVYHAFGFVLPGGKRQLGTVEVRFRLISYWDGEVDSEKEEEDTRHHPAGVLQGRRQSVMYDLCLEPRQAVRRLAGGFTQQGWSRLLHGPPDFSSGKNKPLIPSSYRTLSGSLRCTRKSKATTASSL